jgi:hypothetical protein
VEGTRERLHGAGVRAYDGQIERHGWKTLRDPDVSSRRFWAVAVGVMVEGHSMGRSAEDMCSEMLRVLGDQATAMTAADSTRLRLVGDRDASVSDQSDRENSS